MELRNVKNYFIKNEQSLVKVNDVEQNRTNAALTIEAYLLEPSVIEETFQHILNLFIIYGQEKIDKYIGELKELGMPENAIMTCFYKASRKNCWCGDKYIEDKLNRQGTKVLSMAKR